MVNVALNWHRVEWHPDPEKELHAPVDQLLEAGMSLADLRRSVYVIRLHGNFCIQYPNGQSPTVYVGEGNFPQRVRSHREWVGELAGLLDNCYFQICVATPRVRKNEYAYLDCEAALLERFLTLFGTAPLWNKQKESRRFEHHLYNERQMDQALCKRSGAKYKWAVAPLKASPFYFNYVRTHI
jgi:hypothetical protein